MADVFDFYVYDNRSIVHTSPEPIMQEDKDVAVWRFRIPKVLNNIDMSAWAWWFVYVNAKGQKFSELLTLNNDIDDPESFSTADYSIGYGISKTPGGFTFALEAINTSQGGEISGEWHTRTYTHTVTPTLQGNQAEYAETESDAISALMQEVRNKVNQLVGGATPLPVNLKSLMTDHDKVYLYTGSEDGESTGYWYYWNGTDFVPGGLYGAGILIDPTLSQSGQAADAKAVGDKINSIANYNARDTIEKFGTQVNGTSHEITYTWNGKNRCTINGTSDGTSFNSIFADANSMPSGIVAGEKYYLKYSTPNNNIKLRVYQYINGVSQGSVDYTSDAEITIGSTTTGMIIRLNIGAGVTVSNAEITVALLTAKGNGELANEIEAVKSDISLRISASSVDRTAIAANTDIDALTTAGNYVVQTNTIAETLINYPLSTAGMVFVLTTTQAARIYQIVIPNDINAVKYCRYYSGTWSVWTRIVTDLPVFKSKIAFFGDSITEGINGSTSAVVNNPFPELVGQLINADTTNFGVGSSGYVTTRFINDIAYDIIAAQDLSDYDVIVLAFGVNDGLESVGTADSSDETTVMGQFNKIINYLHETYTKLRVVVVAPWNTYGTGSFPRYHYAETDTRYVINTRLKSRCEYYMIPYITIDSCPVNAFTFTQYVGSDKTHPNVWGYYRIAQWMAGQLHTILGN